VPKTSFVLRPVVQSFAKIYVPFGHQDHLRERKLAGNGREADFLKPLFIERVLWEREHLAQCPVDKLSRLVRRWGRAVPMHLSVVRDSA
jgi:hypothetical protein